LSSAMASTWAKVEQGITIYC
jgi:hypothetical protein